MNPEVVTTYEEIASLPEKVRNIYDAYGKKIPDTSDLNKYLKLCDGIVEKVDHMAEQERVEVHRAQRIFRAMVECNENLKDPKEKKDFNSSISQIAANSLDPRTPGPSHALNMIFELDFLQYVRHRGLEARLGDPDIVIFAPFGEYYVACKTINSFKNLTSNLIKGSSQIKRNGFGVIVLNLEPHICFIEPIKAQSVFEVQALIEQQLDNLYEDHKTLINNHLSAGDFDGVTLQISCMAAIDENPTDLDTITQSVFYSRPNLQSEESHKRFDVFKKLMVGPLFRR